MEFWEFLLQKEGDRSWLPLESCESEILEGRYRIMARSGQSNIPVEIRISYLDLDATPPKRRTHKRTGRVNDQGLVAVMPFTQLRVGKWDIRCSGHGSGESNTPWTHSVQLQVLEEQAHYVYDFDPELESDLSDLEAELNPTFTEEQTPDIASQPSTLGDSTQNESELGKLELSKPKLGEPDSIEENLGEPQQGELNSSVLDLHGLEAVELEASELKEDISNDAGSNRPTEAIAPDQPEQTDLQPTDTDELSDPLNPTGSEEPPDSLIDDLDALLNIGQIDSGSSDELPKEPSSELLDEERDSRSERLRQRPSTPDQSLGFPNDLSLDLSTLSPDIQDDIAEIFQTVDAMAEDILSAMTKQLDAMSELEIGPEINPEIDPEIDHSETVLEIAQTDDSAVPSDAARGDSSIPIPPAPAPETESGRGLNAIGSLSFRLSLSQDAFSLQRGRPLVISGQVECAGDDPLTEAMSAQLVVRLIHPQTGQSLIEDIQPIALSSPVHPPVPFQVLLGPVRLDTLTQTHLLLGEVRLSMRDADTSAAMQPLTLATQAFVVTVELDELLGAIAQPQSSSPAAVDPPLAFVEPEEEPAGTSQDDSSPPAPRPFRIAEEHTLPPKLNDNPVSVPKSRPPLDLPTFVKSDTPIAASLFSPEELAKLAAGQSLDRSENAESEDASSTAPSGVTAPSDVEAEKPPTDSIDNSEPDGSEFDGFEFDNSESDGLELDESDSNKSEFGRSDIDSEIDITSFDKQDAAVDAEAAIPAADLQTDSPQPSDLQASRMESEVSESELTDSEPPEPNPPSELDGPDELEAAAVEVTETRDRNATHALDDAAFHNLAHQFIPDYSETVESAASLEPAPPQGATSEAPFSPDPIDEQDVTADAPFFADDFDADPRSVQASSAPSTPTRSAPETPTDTQPDTVPSSPERGEPVLPEHIAIPIPHLEIAEEELVAGSPVRMVITLPRLAPRIFVKLWVQDRQTRTLLDGPRWIADFYPDDQGQLEARTQLTLPLGCVEVRVEAIAIEVLTQRESHKAVLDRAVVPPDLPAITFDDLTQL